MKPRADSPIDLVVLVHGLGRSWRSFRQMESALRRAGYETLNWDYPSRRHDIAGLMARFAALLGGLAGRRGTVHFVGHSLGAILIRFGVQQRLDFRLGRIVMLAPPNRGVTLVSRLRGVPILPRLFGRPTAELHREAPWLVQGGAPKGEIGVIAGTRTWHPLAPGSWLNRVLALPRPHDGTVELESTQLAGMRDFISVHAIHGRLPSDPEAIRQTLYFLQHGVFERAGRR
jgi:triacylglycerol lipase